MSGEARREWATRAVGDGNATVSKAFRSPAFLRSRAEAEQLVHDASALRQLADRVDAIDVRGSSLELVNDRLSAAVALTRTLADQLDAGTVGGEESLAMTGADAARQRLLIAGLHYLVTPDDLIPDFKAGGYVDDAVLLSCVFGMASVELAAFPGGELEI
ncbi:MAG: DUF1232 domain-containing protein [Nocardioidaceae bacterium]|nr:DUF1232 domain-containing protein [Nocardioidaceae bacterium]